MEDAFDTKVKVPLLEALKTQIVDPVITLLAIASFVVFLYGLVTFIFTAGDAEAQATGRRVMIWGILGLVIVFGAWSIVTIIGSTVGVDANKFR